MGYVKAIIFLYMSVLYFFILELLYVSTWNCILGPNLYFVFKDTFLSVSHYVLLIIETSSKISTGVVSHGQPKILTIRGISFSAPPSFPINNFLSQQSQ